LKCFEKEMSIFTYENMKKFWYQTEQVSSLLGIASEHEDSEVHVMSLKEYGEAKKKENFSKLEEPYKEVQSSLNKENKEEIKIHPFIPRLEEADRYYKDKNFEKALELYNLVNIEMLNIGCETDEIKQKIDEIEAQQDDLERKEKERKEKENKVVEVKKAEMEAKEKEEKKQNTIQSGLSFLEDKNIYDNYKVTNYTGMQSRISRWLKQTNMERVPEDQIPILKKSLFRIYSNPKEMRNKKWKDFENGNIWGNIKCWVGEDIAKEWYNKLANNE